MPEMRALKGTDTVGALLDHTAFAGYAERLLPWDDQRADRALPLSRIGTLLPYHRNVDTGSVVSALNRMIDDVAAGDPVFFDIYSDAEKARTPALRHTGLFYFRGALGAPFAVIAPGGGFAYVGSVHEGFPYAEVISGLGLNAFVIKYRAGAGQRAATEDMARALDVILTQAETLDVGLDGYSLWGSSAGARMAAAVGSHGTAAFGGDDHPGPAAVIMAYTGHSEVTRNEPPTFSIVGSRDGIAPPETMRARIQRLQAQGIAVEFRVVPELGHGFGPGIGTPAEGWISAAVAFWRAARSAQP